MKCYYDCASSSDSEELYKKSKINLISENKSSSKADNQVNKYPIIKEKIIKAFKNQYVIPIKDFYRLLTENTATSIDYSNSECEISFKRNKYHRHANLIKFLNCCKSLVSTFTIKDIADPEIPNSIDSYLSLRFVNYKKEIEAYLKRAVFYIFNRKDFSINGVDITKKLKIQNKNVMTINNFIFSCMFIERLICKLFPISISVPLEHIGPIFFKIYTRNGTSLFERNSFETLVKKLESENAKTVIKKKYASVVFTPYPSAEYEDYYLKKISPSPAYKNILDSIFERGVENFKNLEDDFELKEVLNNDYSENDKYMNLMRIVFLIIDSNFLDEY